MLRGHKTDGAARYPSTDSTAAEPCAPRWRNASPVARCAGRWLKCSSRVTERLPSNAPKKEALRAFVWVIGVGCERVRVVVSEEKALWRYWWHAGKFVDDFRAAAPKGVAGRVSVSRLYAEPRGAARCRAVPSRRRGSPCGCPHPASPPTASPRAQGPSGLLKGSTTQSG